MRQWLSMHSSGLAALEPLHCTLTRENVPLVLCALNEQPLALMRRTGFLGPLGERCIQPDVASALAAAHAATRTAALRYPRAL